MIFASPSILRKADNPLVQGYSIRATYRPYTNSLKVPSKTAFRYWKVESKIAFFFSETANQNQYFGFTYDQNVSGP